MSGLIRVLRGHRALGSHLTRSNSIFSPHTGLIHRGIVPLINSRGLCSNGKKNDDEKIKSTPLCVEREEELLYAEMEREIAALDESESNTSTDASNDLGLMEEGGDTGDDEVIHVDDEYEVIGFDGDLDEEGLEVGIDGARPTGIQSEKYCGVYSVEDRPGWWEVKLEVSGTWLVGGTYPDEQAAAVAHDELAKMIFGDDAQVNFKGGASEAQWQPPHAEQEALFPTRMRELLSIEEALSALEAMNGSDVRVVELEGKSSLGTHMVFVTGKSPMHMRKMADAFVRALLDRGLRKRVNPVVEGRNCDDWMIVDCENLIVHFMEAKYRKHMKLEEHWEGMQMGVDRYAHLAHLDRDALEELMPQPGGEQELHDDDLNLTPAPTQEEDAMSAAAAAAASSPLVEGGGGGGGAAGAGGAGAAGSHLLPS